MGEIHGQGGFRVLGVVGALGLDFVNSEALGHEKLSRIQDTILEAYGDRASVNLMGDKGMIVFGGETGCAGAVKSIVQTWADGKDESPPALVAGLRLGVHCSVGRALSEAEYTHVLNYAMRLATRGALDSVALSAEASSLLTPHLFPDGLDLATARSLRDSANKEVYVIPFNEFLTPDRYIIRMDLPVDILLHLASEPERLYQLTPRKFEEVIADLLSAFGYEVELTKQTRDKGIDIFAIHRATGLGFVERYLIECKRNAPKNRVGIAVVHRLLGVGREEPNTGLIVATTSSFTKPALDLAAKEFVRWRLHLKDYDDIREWLLAYVARRGLRQQQS